jgi:hypothetical protein
MRRALVLAAVIAAAAPAVVAAQPTVIPWNGTNPFRCVLQHAGTGTKVPDPGADPYCVDFDKRHQNVTQLGVVDFLSKEPARVAAASPKCFYFQSDHWRGSIVQDDGSTQTYAWDGHYFFDKARGEGGAWVTDFSVNGHTADPSQVPGMPPQWAAVMGAGTGGAMVENDFPADPRCAARARRDPGAIYRGGRPPGAEPAPAAEPPPAAAPCLAASGRVGARRIGPVALGDPDGRVRRRLGDPFDVRDGFLVYCVHGGGNYLVGELWNGVGAVQDEASAPAVMILTTSGAYRVRGIGPGARARAVRRRFPHASLVARIGRVRVWQAGPRSTLLLGTSGGRVRFLAVGDRRHRASWRALVRRALG